MFVVIWSIVWRYVFVTLRSFVQKPAVSIESHAQANVAGKQDFDQGTRLGALEVLGSICRRIKQDGCKGTLTSTRRELMTQQVIPCPA